MLAFAICPEQTGFSACEEIYVPRAAPAHRGARLLLDHWRTAAGGLVVGRDVPARSLSRILCALALFEPVAADFHIRLAGSGWRRRFGRDVTGENLSAVLDAGQFAAMAECLRAVQKSGTAQSMEVRLMEMSRICLCSEMVLLPVLAPDGRTPRILAGLFFHDWRL